jgi:hypothetical protein
MTRRGFSRTMCRFFIIVFLGAAFSASAETPSRPEQPAYFFSLIIGFGTGPFYLGNNGIGFTLADTAGILCTVGGVSYLISIFENPSAYSMDSYSSAIGGFLLGYGATVGGILIFIAARVWEFVDVAMTIYNRHNQGPVAEIVPTFDITPRRTSFGLSLRY